MQNKNKIGIDALWKKYQHTLELLADALERLETKPKEVEIPVTEFVEVPKIVEVEVIKELTAEQKASYEKQIANLKHEIAQLSSQQPNIGSIIRSAAAFNIDGIIVKDRCLY